MYWARNRAQLRIARTIDDNDYTTDAALIAHQQATIPRKRVRLLIAPPLGSIFGRLTLASSYHASGKLLHKRRTLRKIAPTRKLTVANPRGHYDCSRSHNGKRNLR